MHTEALVVLLAAIFAVTCQLEDGQCVDHLQEIGALKPDLEEPVDYEGAWKACFVPSRCILYSWEALNAEQRTLCGDRLVPYGAPSRMSHPIDGTNATTVPAVNLTSGQMLNVSGNSTFSCVLCQRQVVYYPLFPSAVVFDDMTLSYKFKIYLTAVDNTARGNLTAEAKTEFVQKLSDSFKLPFCPFEYHKEWLDEIQRLHIELRVNFYIPKSVLTGDVETSVLNDTFWMLVEDVGFCPEGDTVDVNGIATHWPRVDFFAENEVFQFAINSSSGAIARRECSFNWETFRGEWDPSLSRWGLFWKSCTLEEQFENEEHYIEFLNSSDIKRRHAELLHNFTTAPVDTDAFQKVARIVELEVKIHNALSERTMRDLAIITAELTLSDDAFLMSLPRAALMVADLTGSEPAEGFTLRFNPFVEVQQHSITLNRKPTVQGRAPFAFDVAARLWEAHTRVVFVVVGKNDLKLPMFTEERPTRQCVEVTVMFPRPGEVSAWSFASYGNHHVDITYNLSVLNNIEDSYLFNFFACLAWNNDLRDWTSKGCKMLYADRGNFSACRCSGKYFVMQDGVPIARYALKRGQVRNTDVIFNNPLTNFLSDKPGLLAATLVELLLSVFGLGSIIGTAICFKQWRENTGHKILLHMTFALTCNLVLGFFASFVHMVTEGTGCLIYGVLRHYSFLAMFLWMLVLSCLQQKRLTTVAGAKTTSHLILKVSLFAWGVPLLPIIFLLSYNYGFYQTDRFDRGYCYPEGIVFQLTVQAPAGIILLVNSAIFVNITTLIFGCRGEKEITRHTKNERAEQLNKLKTSLFIFFLFGFSWVFHIFSEERIIVSDFLFEYLFLMTATTHIFALSIFFVVFQDTTRKKWVKSFRKSSSHVRESFKMKI